MCRLRAPRRPSLVAPLARMDVLELERLLVQHRRDAGAGPLPSGDVAEPLVVAPRLAVLGLVLLAEVAAGGLVTVPRVDAQQAGELEEVGDTAGALEALVEL